jgi:hypothetical protein
VRLCFDSSDNATEKLYQGLRAGSVPIYLGAPNIRNFLPHPDSALLIEDFDNVEALIDYVKRAVADEQLYAKHMVWKSTQISHAFMSRVVSKQMDSIFCRTCDLIAKSMEMVLGQLWEEKEMDYFYPGASLYFYLQTRKIY